MKTLHAIDKKLIENSWLPLWKFFTNFSHDKKLSHNLNLSSFCNFSLSPFFIFYQPGITWRRDDGSPIITKVNSKTLKSDVLEGTTINFTNVNRRHFGAYLCIAKNDVPPAVSKRVFLNVNCKTSAYIFSHTKSGKLIIFFCFHICFSFLLWSHSAVAPNVTIMNEKSVHVLERSHVDIECTIEASPRPVSYWIKEPLSRSFHQSPENPRQNVLQGGDKYAITESLQSYYKTTMRMRISNFSESDVAVYTCIASNVMGRANSTIRLYGKCLTSSRLTFLLFSSTKKKLRRLMATIIVKRREMVQ
jgi:neurotrimin